MIILYAINHLVGLVFTLFAIPIITVLLMPLLFLYGLTSIVEIRATQHITKGLGLLMDRLLDCSEYLAENYLTLHEMDEE